MAISGSTAAAFRAEHAGLARPLIQERARITDAPHYSGSERDRALAPINSQLLALYKDTYLPRLDDMVRRAEVAHLKARPAAQQLRAAYQNPAHAVALKSLGEAAGARGRAELALLCAEGSDLAGGFGLRQALGDDELNTVAVLGSIGSAVAETATADLVLALNERAKFVGAGPFDDPTTNPVESMRAADAVKVLPDGMGGTITLDDEQVKHLLEVAGA
jgi:hypothetical protein